MDLRQAVGDEDFPTTPMIFHPRQSNSGISASKDIKIRKMFGSEIVADGLNLAATVLMLILVYVVKKHTSGSHGRWASMRVCGVDVIDD